jgi:hypothetical protein
VKVFEYHGVYVCMWGGGAPQTQPPELENVMIIKVNHGFHECAELWKGGGEINIKMSRSFILRKQYRKGLIDVNGRLVQTKSKFSVGRRGK